MVDILIGRQYDVFKSRQLDGRQLGVLQLGGRQNNVVPNLMTAAFTNTITTL
jgi:hypothetical protein